MNCTAGNGSKARGSSTGGGGGPQSSLLTVFDSRRAFVSLCAMILSATFASRRNQLWYTTHELLQNISGTPFFKAELHVSDSQLFGAYWVPGNVLHLMYMNSSEPPYKVRIIVFRASQVAWWVKNPPAIKETETQPLGWEDPLKEGRATHSSTLAWRIPGTEESGGLQPMGLQRVRHDWATERLSTHTYTQQGFHPHLTDEESEPRRLGDSLQAVQLEKGARIWTQGGLHEPRPLSHSASCRSNGGWLEWGPSQAMAARN